MQAFWEIVASNAVLVVALALLVALLGRVWKQPAVLHVLWVLVLLKLFTPPMLTIGVPWPVSASRAHPPERADDGEAPWVAIDASFEQPAAVTRGHGRRSTTIDGAGTGKDRPAAGGQSLPWSTLLAWS